MRTRRDGDARQTGSCPVDGSEVQYHKRRRFGCLKRACPTRSPLGPGQATERIRTHDLVLTFRRRRPTFNIILVSCGL
ncbi:hypothetical protein PsYK624_012870 [Phanerochaete sordida]|uniref:Uncharacterized protein n=1 Tax=Phanerochaete sordida TaxID=48140 RepID=A0A9P3L869_9APHY|nr:hypothetical protein PsYK624_012870 [Phanerochaete sordida]